MKRRSWKNAGVSCIISLIFITTVRSQVLDDFSDGNFSSNPVWTGDTNRFEVNSSGQLHLKSAGTDSSYLSTGSQLLDSTEWICWVKQSFSPSASNFGRIYLVSDQADLKASLNGFYLQLGEAGSSDALQLFRQQGNQHFSVCRGRDGFIAASFSIRVKITRNSAGEWAILADSTGGNLFTPQAAGFDDTPVTPAYAGIYCKYTSSNATKFYFDDVIVRPIQLDLVPPLLIHVNAPDEHRLELQFSEPIYPITLSDTSHYFVNQDIGRPYLIQANSLDPAKVILVFSKPLSDKTEYLLTAEGVADLSGNLMLPCQIPFFYYRVKAFDVVINEIMADPEPQLGLPPVEYLELYNRSDYPVNLENWRIQLGSSVKQFPSFTLKSKSFVLLGNANAGILFSAYGDFIGFSSFTLANEGSTLTLSTGDNQVVHTVTYSNEWYEDPLKAAGGWSLEQLDPFNPCAGKANWRTSISGLGGTPGQANSVKKDNPDRSPPVPDRITVINEQMIRVFFSEPVDSGYIKGPDFYSIQPGSLKPLLVYPLSPAYCSFDMVLPGPMEKGFVYTLTFHDSLKDCAGNSTPGGYSILYGLPEMAEKGDVVINEILFNPETDGAEFVEIYNNSKKIIELKDLILAKTDSITLFLTNKYELTVEGRLFFPGEYLALTTDPDRIRLQYHSCNPAGLALMQPFPLLVNEGGCISLAKHSDELLDLAVYAESMQFPSLTTKKGVSLERISPSVAGNDCRNWHSASSTAGYATPAVKNSQSVDGILSDADITLDPPVFSPDNDGYQDLLSISCHLSEPGYLGNIIIFNRSGQPVRTLASNELLGIDNQLCWDGIDQKGYKSPMGIYIVFFEFYNTSGEVRHIKKVTVLGGRL